MPPLRTGYILAFWAPLAATWLMMAFEGPYLTAIVARLPDGAFNLAAYGIAFSIALIVEAPIMMMLTASNALVRSRASLHALRRFTYTLNTVLTGVIAVIALPPVFVRLADLMDLPADIASLAHWATAVVLPWPAAIGYRRFYQGLLVRAGRTRDVAYGTVIRLATMSAAAAALAWGSTLPGAVIGGLALSAGVVAEAAASRWMARPVVRALEDTAPAADEPPLSTRAIVRFYYPLALTSVLSLITAPLITFLISHSRRPIDSLAVLPVVNAFVFLFRSGAFAYQEVVVALGGPQREHEAEIRKVTGLLAVASSGALGIVLTTGLVDAWLLVVSGLSFGLAAFALVPVQVLVLFPALEYVLACQRGLLILARRTRTVTVGTAVEAVGIAVALAACVGPLGMTGAVSAAVALMAGRIGANVFQGWALRQVPR